MKQIIAIEESERYLLSFYLMRLVERIENKNIQIPLDSDDVETIHLINKSLTNWKWESNYIKKL